MKYNYISIKYIFIVFFILTSVLLIYPYFKKLYAIYQADIDMSPIIERVVPQKVVPASDVIRQFFPKVDQDQYILMCSKAIDNPYILEESFTIKFALQNETIAKAFFTQENALSYYPYYIFLINEDGTRFTHKVSAFTYNNYQNFNDGRCNRQTETNDEIKGSHTPVQSETGKYIYTIPCISIKDAYFYAYPFQSTLTGKKHVAYGFAMSEKVNKILKGEQ